MMKIFVFKGGLGNQLFQYVFLKYQEQHSGFRAKWLFYGKSHNGMEIQKYFDISLPKKANPLFDRIHHYCYRLLLKTGLRILITDDESKSFNWRLFISGYWQDKQYYKEGVLQFKELALSEKNADILDKIRNSNSVAIHVRRGDYLLPQYAPLYSGICNLDYYRKAIELSRDKIPDAVCFFFSDDIEWVKDNIGVPNANYVDWNRGEDSVFDMYLMSFAQANIIANSSFSYWAARLNKRNHLVIYPSKWYNEPYKAPNIFPTGWIGINS